MDYGYFRLPREIVDSVLMDLSGDQCKVAIWLLRQATHQPHSRLHGGERITLQPGQLQMGNRAAAERIGVGVQVVKTTLSQLALRGFLTREPTRYGTVVTICHWERYQDGDADANPQADPPLTQSQPAANPKQVFLSSSSGSLPLSSLGITHDVETPCAQAKSRPKAKTHNGYDPEFERWYLALPAEARKGKKAAARAWAKATDKPDTDALIEICRRQEAAKARLRKAGAFCPPWKHAATWLNQGCWDDEIETGPESATDSDEFDWTDAPSDEELDAMLGGDL